MHESFSLQPGASLPYSSALLQGSVLYISGQSGIDPATGNVAGEGIGEQTEQALRNVQALVEAAGLRLSDVVKTTVMLADINDFARMNDVYSRFFKSPMPARSTFQVAALPRPEWRVEIEAMAARSADASR